MSINQFDFLPPAPNKCQSCAVEHPPEHPHDATSLFYQFWFQREHGRSPTWNDALTHCSEKMQRHWHLHLSNLGIDPDSTSTRGGIKTVEELATRLAGVAHLYRDESLSQEYPFGSIAIDPNGKRLKLIGIRSHTDNYRRWIGVLQLLSEKAIGVAEPTIFLTDKIENLEKLN